MNCSFSPNFFSISDHLTYNRITSMISVFLLIAIGLAKECLSQEQSQESQQPKNEVCYNQVGCFSQEAPWVSPLRPFPPPRSPEEQNIRFFLVTENTRNTQPITDLQVQTTSVPTALWSLGYLDYRPDRPVTVFINHGFMAGVNSEWMGEMSKAYLSRTDANVFIVDWEDGAKGANYLQVAANIRVVGVMAARFLLFLIERTNLQSYQVHCIGHSLGAHICGYMGKQVPGIARITALDAAQLGFEGFDPVVRLNQTDAYDIDVIHTNAKPTIPTFGLGYISPLGDIDYYFNGGFHQPNCIDAPLNAIEFTNPMDVARLPVEVIKELISCSHSMAVEYFIEAIRRTDCTMWGRQNNPVTGVMNLATFGIVQQLLEKVYPCTLDTCSPVGLLSFRYPARGKFQVSTYFSPEYCIPDARSTESMHRQFWQWYRYAG